MMLEFDNYLFDKDKFLLSVLNGDVYKTQYIISEVINNKGFLTVSNKFNYKKNLLLITLISCEIGELSESE